MQNGPPSSELLPPPTQSAEPRVRQVLAIAGSRGGVGCSLVSVNLAVYLAQLGRTVVLVDADPAGAYLHSLLGVPAQELASLPDNEQLLAPLKTRVPGLLLEPQRYSVGLTQPTRPGRKPRWARDLRGLDADYVIVDLGVSTQSSSLELFLQADVGVLVTSPDPPSIEGAYRMMRALFQRRLRRALARDSFNLRLLDRVQAALPPLPEPLAFIEALARYDTRLGDIGSKELAALRPRLVVNGTRLRNHTELGPAIRDLTLRFLGLTVDYVGAIEQDDAVWLSVNRQRPLLIDSPSTKAARNLERIARRLLALAGAHEPIRTAHSTPASSGQPTLYDILTTHPAASDDELRKAYKRQREIYQTDSLPLASLLSHKELLRQQALVEEAHETLLDPVKRRAYDLSTLPERHTPSNPPQPPEDAVQLAERALLRDELAHELTLETRFTGALLRKVRQANGIALQEVSRRTKISRLQLKAIEEEAYEQLPAYVYLRGFVQEVAKVLDLDPPQVARTYLRRYSDWHDSTSSRR